MGTPIVDKVLITLVIFIPLFMHTFFSKFVVQEIVSLPYYGCVHSLCCSSCFTLPLVVFYCLMNQRSVTIFSFYFSFKLFKGSLELYQLTDHCMYLALNYQQDKDRKLKNGVEVEDSEEEHVQLTTADRTSLVQLTYSRSVMYHVTILASVLNESFIWSNFNGLVFCCKWENNSSGKGSSWCIVIEGSSFN